MVNSTFQATNCFQLAFLQYLHRIILRNKLKNVRMTFLKNETVAY